MNVSTDTGRPVEILLAEDNVGDVVLTKQAFENSKILNNVTVANDGDELLSMLKQQQEEGKTPPDLILLDLNMPNKDGKQALAEIKNDDRLKRIPVVVLTSSMAERDIIETYNLHANSYLIKPVSLGQYHKIVEAIESFWFSVAVLPVQ
jgi:CheY-like chemotaxis protein